MPIYKKTTSNAVTNVSTTVHNEHDILDHVLLLKKKKKQTKSLCPNNVIKCMSAQLFPTIAISKL